MELPTYTSIWRIEKRLYKLYDFRLPMPLPVGQIFVFTGITVPYVVLLTLAGLPFTHNLFWLYVLPPGVFTWLTTRPVLESKRLPELVISQLRYLGEPAVWCRLAPCAEKDEIVLEGRVWRRTKVAGDGGATAPAASRPAPVGAPSPVTRWPHTPAPVRSARQQAPASALDAGAWERAPARRAVAAEVPVPERVQTADRAVAAERVPAPDRAVAAERVPAPDRAVATDQAPGAPPGRAVAGPSGTAPRTGDPAAADVPGDEPEPAPGSAAPALPSEGSHPGVPTPVVVVPVQRSLARPVPPVEHALGGPAGHRTGSWRNHVVVVPGGQGPGRPDYDKRDKARAELELDGPRLVVVLGCTVGAGQTVITLVLAELLASVRDAPVAALDLNPGPASLTHLARRPAATVSALLAGRVTAGRPGHGLRGSRDRSGPDVISCDSTVDTLAESDHRRLVSMLAGQYQLILADPGASSVARLLAVADQLLLVTPCSPDASRAAAMTWEWLDANGHGALAANAIMVLNGLSKRSLGHAEQAEAVAKGRCRAIVRVPWDDHLAAPAGERVMLEGITPPGEQPRLRQLRPPVRQAYTALAGVLIAGLAARPAREGWGQ